MTRGQRLQVVGLVVGLGLLSWGVATLPRVRHTPPFRDVDLLARFARGRLADPAPEPGPVELRPRLVPDPARGAGARALRLPTSGVIRYDLLVPDRGVLELEAAATPAGDGGVEARVAAEHDDAVEIIAVLPLDAIGRKERLSLGHLGGRLVTLRLEVSPGGPAAPPGAALWRTLRLTRDDATASGAPPIARLAESCQKEAATVPVRRPEHRTPIRAVHYFQPYAGFSRFWSDLDLGVAESDFAQIRRDGFDTVILMVPWGAFQQQVSPVRYHERQFEQLDRLFDLAERAGLGVVLRVGSHEVVPEGALGRDFAPTGVLTSTRDLAAYAALFEEVARRTAQRRGLRFLYWTWEDVYSIPLHVFRTTEATRLEFVAWLRAREPLSYWNQRWHESNRTWADVTLPDYHLTQTEKIRDYWRFHDGELILGRAVPCLLAAVHRGNPRAVLGVQPRIDADHEYTHEETFRVLPGYGIIATWFGPYQAIVEGFWGPRLSVVDAMTTLHRLRARAQRFLVPIGGRPLFYDQVFFRQFHVPPSLPRLAEADEGPFMAAALRELCGAPDVLGYGLWTWRDYVLNELPNPGFEEGLRRWSFVGRPGLTRDAARGDWALEIDPDNHPLLTPAAGLVGSRTVGFLAKGVGASRLDVDVQWRDIFRSPLGWRRTLPVDLSPSYRAVSFVLDRPKDAYFVTLRLRPVGGRARLDEVQLFDEIDTTGLYSLTGEPRPMRDVLAHLNRTVCAG